MWNTEARHGEFRKKMNRKSSTLELTVLGLLWLRGPCTIYSIMKELSLSASSYHSNRAGTTYSVANRLLSQGLMASDGENVQITEKGLETLQEWLEAPIPMSDIAHSSDMIRLRFFFLGAVDVPAREALIDSAVDGLKQFLKRCEELVHENEAIGDYFGVLATLSTILETRARIEWLNLVREMVEGPKDANWATDALARLSKARQP